MIHDDPDWDQDWLAESQTLITDLTEHADVIAPTVSTATLNNASKARKNIFILYLIEFW